jgi:hypothetical protein
MAVCRQGRYLRVTGKGICNVTNPLTLGISFLIVSNNTTKEITMKDHSVVLFTRYGMGQAEGELPLLLVGKYLTLTIESGKVPGKILLYTDGVRLACEGSPVLDQLSRLENQGVELVLCKTCLDIFGITSRVKVGIVGGMGDILESLQQAEKVISL